MLETWLKIVLSCRNSPKYQNMREYKAACTCTMNLSNVDHGLSQCRPGRWIQLELKELEQIQRSYETQ